MRNVRFHRPKNVGGVPGYSHVAEIVSGRLAIVAGQVPLNARNELVGEGDIGEQAEQCFRNIDEVLRAANGSIRDVVKFTYFVRDGVEDLTKIRAVRDRFVDTAQPPASTLVYVAGLYDARVLVEIEAMAVLDPEPPPSG